MVQNSPYKKRETGMDARIFAHTSEARCPFLGLANDRATVLGYPNNRNRCHRHDLPVPVTKSRQSAYCLSGKHGTCSIFLQKHQPDDTPEKVSIGRKWPSRLALILPLVLIIIAALVWWPTPGTRIEESRGSAAPMQNSIAADGNSLPRLCQKIVVTKEKTKSTLIGSETATPTHGSESTSQENKPAEGGAGGFLILDYE